MEKSRSHQIDDLAQRILRDALPPTWIVNKQSEDYAKDYLVEIGDENGRLTGTSFYIQLKGQAEADLSADGATVPFSLESKYAEYYLDKVSDLPVFLILVDVNKKIGWWTFLQPLLRDDQKWRKQKSITLRLPTANSITEISQLQVAIVEANKWMRVNHPQSIHESIVAHKQRITRTDPRFAVEVSLANEKPVYNLSPKEDVSLRIEITGDQGEVDKKITDLLDKGLEISFQPGEIKVTGSKIFESFEQFGGKIRCNANFAATLSFICYDCEGKELARLSDLPGRFTGGRKEMWFEGKLADSPFTIKAGPFTEHKGGSLQVNLDLSSWDKQPLRKLAYFDRLHRLFQALPQSARTIAEFQKSGNTVLSVPLSLQSLPFVVPLADYLEHLWKARKVSEWFDVNPLWTVDSFDRVSRKTADELYGVLLGNGWSQPSPKDRFTATFLRKTFRLDVVEKTPKPETIKLTTEPIYLFLGEKLEVQRLVYEYTNMKVNLEVDSKLTPGNSCLDQLKPSADDITPDDDTVLVSFSATENTVKSVRRATPED